MFQTNAFSRFRMMLASLFLIAGVAMPVGASAQAAGTFVLTSAQMQCESSALDLSWQKTGVVSAISVSVTNASNGWTASADVPTPDGLTSYSMPVYQAGASHVFVRATLAGDPARVFEYTAVLGACGTPSSIGGGQVSQDTNNPQIPITITNLSCTGFDWTVSAPFEVRVYVSVMDMIGHGMIPYVPVNGTELSRSESYTVTTETQNWFGVLIAVHDVNTNEELARKSMSRECPIATVTPTVTATSTSTMTPSITPDVDDGTVTVIQIQMPNGESIEGAPYQLFAPSAAMQAGPAPLQTGVVGANNTITLHGLIEGQYRIVIQPVGMDAIDFTFAVGTDKVTNLLAVVNADGTVTVTPLQTGPTPTSTAPTTAPGGSTSGSGDAVSGLPATGAGEAQASATAWVVAVATALFGGLCLAVIRRSAITS